MKGTQAEFARHLGVNRSTVNRGIKSGRILVDAEGRIDFDAATARWHATAGGRTDVAARHAAERGHAIPGSEKTAHSGAQPATPQDPGAAAPERSSAKLLVLKFENDTIKIEMALRRGLRLDRTAVRRESTALGAMLRAGVERIIDHTAPRLAATGNLDDRRRILAAEIARLRWIIKREMPRALRRMRQSERKRAEP